MSHIKSPWEWGNKSGGSSAGGSGGTLDDCIVSYNMPIIFEESIELNQVLKEKNGLSVYYTDVSYLSIGEGETYKFDCVHANQQGKFITQLSKEGYCYIGNGSLFSDNEEDNGLNFCLVHGYDENYNSIDKFYLLTDNQTETVYSLYYQTQKTLYDVLFEISYAFAAFAKHMQ